MGNPQYTVWKRINAFNKCKRRAVKAIKEPTEAEALMWTSLQRLNQDLPADCFFQRQFVMMPYRLDFYCKKAKVAIEVDGSIHDDQVRADKHRDNFLQSNFGILTYRITNEGVYDFKHRQAFLNKIKNLIKGEHPK
jgi:very-short-patch-repair endonuclease